MAGLKISAAEVKQALDDVGRWKARAQTVAKTGERATERIVRTVEVSAAGFALGMAKGKWGPSLSVWGIPVDLIAGLGLHGLGYLGVAGKHEDHLHAFGDGALAVWFAGLGAGVGAKIGSPKQIKQGYMGALPGEPVAPPSDQEVAAAAASM
jgi:hypothetical protein